MNGQKLEITLERLCSLLDAENTVLRTVAMQGQEKVNELEARIAQLEAQLNGNAEEYPDDAPSHDDLGSPQFPPPLAVSNA